MFLIPKKPKLIRTKNKIYIMMDDNFSIKIKPKSVKTTQYWDELVRVKITTIDTDNFRIIYSTDEIYPLIFKI